jgi:RNA polymerase sigma-70 factor (ECF subfamily)
VKAALHRGRAKLAEGEAMASEASGPPKALIERFMAALQAKNYDAIRDLCLADVAVEHVGGAGFTGFDAGRLTFQASHFVMPAFGFGENPHWRLETYKGEPIVVGFRTLDGYEGINEIWRLEADEGAVSRVRLYAFTPDLLAAIAEEMGVRALKRPYRSPSRN